jgi:hypothetical protein
MFHALRFSSYGSAWTTVDRKNVEARKARGRRVESMPVDREEAEGAVDEVDFGRERSDGLSRMLGWEGELKKSETAGESGGTKGRVGFGKKVEGPAVWS